MTHLDRNAARAALFSLTMLLTACGGSSGDGAGGAPASGPVGSADAESWQAAQGYMDVIAHSSAFDECLTRNPAAEPWKCLRGPRSGSALGHAVAEWMRSRLAAIDGLTGVRTQRFSIPGFAPRAYDLTVDADDGATPIAAFPWYYRGTTPAAGVAGPIVDLGKGGTLAQLLAGDLSGKVAYLEISLALNAESGKADGLLQQIEDKGALAAIVATDAPANEIAAQNFDVGTGRRALPTLIVGKQDGARIAALAGHDAHVTIEASIADQSSDNVIARLPGADPSHIIVVGTPINAWLTASGERAPGVGILIYLARYFAEQARKNGPLPYTIDFVATGGHELYAAGVDRYLSCLAPESIMAYVHLGSGLVYAGYANGLDGEPKATGGLSQARTLAVSENTVLRGVSDPAFSAPALQPYFSFPPSLFIPGENRAPYAKGIPTVGMNGTNAYFHTAADDATQIVRAALGPMAEAFRDSVAGLLQTDAMALARANALAAALGAGGDAPFWECAD
ncbi:hypothetical protein [Solimonas soli]|uniref:hypothetical protein n=1 Tax=Solimonas soli TaxID=413479 RepID=UPI000484EBCB|nr:hypothetical protein [Solimonas soli]